MRDSSKISLCAALVSLVVVLLAGRPAILPAAAEGPPAGKPDRPAEEAARAQSYTGGPPLSAIRGVGLKSLLGREVRTMDEDPGRIIDILCDRDGQVRAAVVELGGFLGIGTRKVAVEWSSLRFDGNEKRPIVVLEMTRDQLRSAPEYKSGDPVLMRRTD